MILDGLIAFPPRPAMIILAAIAWFTAFILIRRNRKHSHSSFYTALFATLIAIAATLRVHPHTINQIIGYEYTSRFLAFLIGTIGVYAIVEALKFSVIPKNHFVYIRGALVTSLVAMLISFPLTTFPMGATVAPKLFDQYGPYGGLLFNTAFYSFLIIVSMSMIVSCKILLKSEYAILMRLRWTSLRVASGATIIYSIARIFISMIQVFRSNIFGTLGTPTQIDAGLRMVLICAFLGWSAFFLPNWVFTPLKNWKMKRQLKNLNSIESALSWVGTSTTKFENKSTIEQTMSISIINILDSIQHIDAAKIDPPKQKHKTLIEQIRLFKHISSFDELAYNFSRIGANLAAD